MVGSGFNVLPAEEDRSSNKRTPKVRRKYALERSLSIAEEFCATGTLVDGIYELYPQSRMRN